MASVHEDFRLDHRHDPLLLAQYRIPTEGVRVHLNAVGRRHTVAYGDDRSPLAENRAEFSIFGETLSEPVEALSHNFVGRKGEWLCANVGLDARQDSLIAEDLHKRRSIRGLLPDCLVVEDHTAYEFRDAWRAEQHLPIGPSVGFGVVDADRVEPFLYRGGAFVRREDAFAGFNKGASSVRQILHSELRIASS